MKGILGRKQGMTRVFLEDGAVEPVSVVEAGPCVVTQVKTRQRHGYQAVQLGYEEAKKLNEPEAGHLKRVTPLRYLREFRADDLGDAQIGQRIDVGIFQPGDLVDVIGVSKGKGFAGGVKRHHFAGGPKTHGQSDRQRSPGSIGAGTSPGRVWKGTPMAGHMGYRRVTATNLKVVQVDQERNLLLVKGAVPGARNGMLMIKESRRRT
ncbi:MAG: 50S ribosomal protein L3 [Chloroflexota bacterium]